MHQILTADSSTREKDFDTISPLLSNSYVEQLKEYDARSPSISEACYPSHGLTEDTATQQMEKEEEVETRSNTVLETND
jgi:hypothetical protein